MNAKNMGKTEITPELYKKILYGLNLDNLFLISCSSTIDRTNLGTEIEIKVKDDASFVKAEQNKIQIIHKYSLGAINKPTNKKFLTIKADFCLIYSSEEEFTEVFFERFKNASLPINSWPFFREFVSNITSRMYIPPLTLPLIKR